jgi:putative polyhydroxyalkanoate system protein
MAQIDISRRHTLGREAARAAAERIAGELAGRYGLSHRWQGDDLQFEGGGAKGRIQVAADNVRVTASLGFPASLARGKIEQAVKRYLEELLTQA